MSHWMNPSIGAERHQDLLRKAEMERRLRRLMAAQPATPGPYAVLMAWLGRRLVIWGERLQARYGRPQRIPQPAP